jgi:hypothetical protein
MINYNNKKFRVVKNTENGETSSSTVFLYKQKNNIMTSRYSDHNIKTGNLIGIVDKSGSITMAYHQINHKDEIMTGKCISTPEIMDNGKIRLHEKWQWTSGDLSSGESIIEEI